MLLRFGVANHLSIRDYQELSCVASSVYDDLPHTITIQAPGVRANDSEILPVVAVYGANAAGKSNLLDALAFFARAIRRSYLDWDELEKLPHQSFSLDNDYSDKESIYECDVLIDGVRHQYGFGMTKLNVTQEWLYSFPKGIRNILFQRTINDETVDYYFGPNLKGITGTWKAIAEKKNILLLSAAGKSEHKHEKLTEIFKYFQKSFKSVQITAENESRLADQIQSTAIRDRLVQVLKAADFGIEGIELKSVEFPAQAANFMKKFVVLLKESLPDITDPSAFSSAPTEQLKIQFRHRGVNGETFLVDYENESSGTKYLMSLLVPVMEALEKGTVLIVDEITTNLHTKLSEKILQLFSDQDKNKSHAQFIFSTHDTNLLSRELLRRDEIWFAEKDDEGATSIYPLSDFKIRKNDNVERGYLQGRFGAIPFMGDVSVLLS